MGVEALTQNDSDVEVAPKTAADWNDWVSATATRNLALDDPVLDWLNLYGRAKGLRPDREYPEYNERTDSTRLICPMRCVESLGSRTHPGII